MENVTFDSTVNEHELHLLPTVKKKKIISMYFVRFSFDTIKRSNDIKVLLEHILDGLFLFEEKEKKTRSIDHLDRFPLT